MQELIIDRCRPNELQSPCIYNFINKVYIEYFPNLELEYDVMSYSYKLSTRAYAIIAYRENRAALLGGAFGYCNNLETKEAYLSFFAKTKDAPKGLATRLHNDFLAMAYNYGMRTIALEVRKNNDHAIDFYYKQGYSFRADHGAKLLLAMQIPPIEMNDNI